MDKIKRMGASAVKLLLYYRPDLREIAARQEELAQSVAAECTTHDLPLLVETVSYPAGEEVGDPALFARRRPDLVIGTADRITRLGVDVLKTEFPADLSYEHDERRLAELCRELDQASRTPWVILSAGVGYDVFRRQVEIACRNGASGFLGGRAIWQDAFRIMDKGERTRYLSSTVADRLKGLAEIASRHATAWYRKLGVDPDRLLPVEEGWHERY